MAGAGLLVLFAAVGVNFGWQPMPDGSARYEYVVQLEPEVAATLADGKSIPIVSEVPEEIRPVARVRVVVGKGDLPRQRLVTRLKPADTTAEAPAEKKDGVALAQYNQYDNQRYAQAPANDPQPQANQAAGTTEWNSGGAQAPITPTAGGVAPGQQGASANQGATPSTAWNDPGQTSVAAAGPLGRLGENLQRAATQPVRQGLEQADQQLRSATEKFGSRTRELVEDLSKPFGAAQAQSPGKGNESGNPGESPWNSPTGDAATSAGTNGNNSTINWNGSSGIAQAPPAASTEAPRYGQAATGAPAATANSQTPVEWNNGGASTIGSNTRDAAPPLSTGGKDPFAAAPDPRSQPVQSSSGIDFSKIYPYGANGSEKPYAGAGAAWPGMGTPMPELGPTADLPGRTPNADVPAGSSAATTGVPEIRRGMLEAPADEPLERIAAAPQRPLTGSSSHQPEQIPARSQSGATTGPWPTTQAGQPGPSEPQSAANDSPVRTTGQQPLATQAQPTGRDNTAVVLAAWVLLTGSVAGNLYLFWSYVDVRQKYRVLVRKTARTVGRYTPA